VLWCVYLDAQVLTLDEYDLMVFFFFQAEDGIRDGHVTGVQTCALPICPAADPVANCRSSVSFGVSDGIGSGTPGRFTPLCELTRSEERRVGKECRSRGAP